MIRGSKRESPRELPSQSVLLAIITSLLAVITCLIGLLTLLLCHQFADTPAAESVGHADTRIFGQSWTLGPPSAGTNLSELYAAALTDILGQKDDRASAASGHRRRLLDQLGDGNCRRSYRQLRALGFGWSKATHLAVDTDTGETLALKRPHVGGHDMVECLRNQLGDVGGCYRKLAAKFLRELVFLQLMGGTDGIIQLKGWCLSSNDFYVATEVGTPLEIISLLQMSWEDRLRIARDVSQLLHSLHASPVGSLALRDFRRGQFAQAEDGRLKLIDLDDLDRTLPQCSRPEGHCSEKVDKLNYVRTRCQRSACPGHNERANLHRAHVQFYNFLLLHGAPPGLAGSVRAIRNGLAGGRVGGSRELRDAVQLLVRRYSAGDYPLLAAKDEAATEDAFHLMANSTIAGGDYPCRYTIAGSQCNVTANSLDEARMLCAGEPACRAFVVTPNRSWTNRTVIILKSGADNVVKSVGHHLYLRRQ